MEHVETDPDEMPSPPDVAEIERRLNENFEGRRIELAPDDWDDADEDVEPVDASDIDFDTDYPTR